MKEDRFETITRRKGWSLVYQGILAAIDAGFDSVKVNCVVINGFNSDEICDFVDLAQKYPIEVRFIEFMPFAGNDWEDGRLMPYRQMLQIALEKYPNLKRVSSSVNDVSKVFRDSSMPGSIGFITSMTDNFCSGCNRLRITADGNLKVCLFGREETSLRDLMRNSSSDTEIVQAIARSLYAKKLQHAGEFLFLLITRGRQSFQITYFAIYYSGTSKLQSDAWRPMVKIGG